MNRFSILIICFSFFISCSNIVSAQIGKGNYILGGTAGVDNLTNANGNSLTTIFIRPMYGSFLTDHFLIGGNANLNYQFNGKRGRSTIKLGPLVRYYFNNVFIQADYNFGIPSRNYIENDIYARLGYAYFLNDHVAIEPYVYIGLINLINRRSSDSYNYLDDGIYFSIQVYLESSLNKMMKQRKGNLRGKQ